MITIKELYVECIQNPYPYLAYSLYYLLCEGLVFPDDPHTSFDSQLVDREKVDELFKQDFLCLSEIKVYCFKSSREEYAFLFATNSLEARELLIHTYNIQPLSCQESYLDFSILREDKLVTFREMKKDFSSFPALIGFFQLESVYK